MILYYMNNNKLDITHKSSSPNNSEINRIISNLKLLSSIPAGHKLAIRNNRIVIHCASSWGDWCARIYNGDSREHMCTYLEALGNDILKILTCEFTTHIQKLRIQEQINNCITGLKHLQNTYFNDISCRCTIETIIENFMNMSKLKIDNARVNVGEFWIAESKKHKGHLPREGSRAPGGGHHNKTQGQSI